LKTSLEAFCLAIAVLASALVAGSPVSATDDVDRRDPASVARAFLVAHQAEDVATLAALVNDRNRAFFDGLLAAGRADPDWNEVFGGWRGEAVRSWTDPLGATRYRSEQALVPFVAMGDDEIAVIVLTEDPVGWGVEDLHSPSRADLEMLPIAR